MWQRKRNYKVDTPYELNVSVSVSIDILLRFIIIPQNAIEKGVNCC